MKKDRLREYWARPYERSWSAFEEGNERYFVVSLKDIPVVAGDGATKDEAVEDLRVAFDEYIEWRLSAALPIPEPGRKYTPLADGVSVTLSAMNEKPKVPEYQPLRYFAVSPSKRGAVVAEQRVAGFTSAADRWFVGESPRKSANTPRLNAVACSTG